MDKQKIALVDEVDVYVSQHVEHMNRKPAHCKGRHQERHQAEDLSLSSLVRSCLVLCPVARCDTLPQFDSDTEVGHKDG